MIESIVSSWSVDAPMAPVMVPFRCFFGNLFGVPFYEPEAQATATFLNRDVMLVVDRSGSMLGTKFADLTAAIAVFTATLRTTNAEEFVGLASYSDTASIDVALTPDLCPIVNAVSRLPSSAPLVSREAWTLALPTLVPQSRRFVDRTMIVMTDGVHNSGQTLSAQHDA